MFEGTRRYVVKLTYERAGLAPQITLLQTGMLAVSVIRRQEVMMSLYNGLFSMVLNIRSA